MGLKLAIFGADIGDIIQY